MVWTADGSYGIMTAEKTTADQPHVKITIERVCRHGKRYNDSETVTVDISYVIMTIEKVSIDKLYDIMIIENVIDDKSYVMMTIGKSELTARHTS